MDSRLPDDEKLLVPKADPPLKASESLTTSPEADSGVLDTTLVVPLKQDDADPSSLIPGKLALLEEQLKNIGKTLTLHVRKEEVLTRSLVELESKINTIEKSLREKLYTQSATHTPTATKTMDQESAASQAVSATGTKQQIERTHVTSFSQSPSGEPPGQTGSSYDFSPPGVNEQGGNENFFSGSPDEFEKSSETDELPLDITRYERKKSLFIIIPVLCLLALFLFLVFYYNNLQKQKDQKLIITEKISISSVPAEKTESQTASVSGVLADSRPGMKETQAPPQEVIPEVAAGNEDASSGIALQKKEPALPGRFTVAVGSFKQKSNATALTARLNQKGYAAQMTLLQGKKLFRVTVGTFSSRSEANAMASRLTKNEKLQTALIDLKNP